MLERLQDLKTTGSDAQIITKLINKEFSMNFHYKTIYYQLRKLTDNILGEINDDAYNFVSMLEQDHNIRGGFYDIMKDDDGKLLNCCYMTQRMHRVLESFSDVLIIDTSHKTNRFNLPLLDIVVINNLGKTITCFISLLKDQKFESFQWALSRFAKWSRKPIGVVFSDDEEALGKGKSLFAI